MKLVGALILLFATLEAPEATSAAAFVQHHAPKGLILSHEARPPLHHALSSSFLPRRLSLQMSDDAASTAEGTAPSRNEDDVDDWYADFDPSEWNVDNDDVHSWTGNDDNGDRRRGRGRRGGGGQRGWNRDEFGLAGHDYDRDLDADGSNVDVEAVDRLLSDRLRARRTGRFDEADAIRESLLSDHGVMVFDREKLWRTGCSASGSGMGRRPGRGGRRQQGRSRGSPRQERDFGPLGHDYRASVDAGPPETDLNEDDINSLIAERLQCKLNRDFTNADRIQEHLAAEGVYVHDGRKEWRADGVPFGDYPGTNDRNPGRERGSRTDLGPNGHDYYPASDAGPATSPLPEGEIHTLLAERLQCKMNRDFRTADEIQTKLIANGVFVHDKRKEWRADGQPFEDLMAGRGGNDRTDRRRRNDRNQSYVQSEYSKGDSLEREDVRDIQFLLSERNKAKRKRDYVTADEIRDELRDDFNVVVDDKLKAWSVGGDFGPDANSQREQRPDPERPYARVAGSPSGDHEEEIDEEEEFYITSHIERRNEARKDRNFDLADSIKKDLFQKFGVVLNDKKRQWSIGGDESSSRKEDWIRRGGGDLAEEEVALIVSKVSERADAKKARNFELADSIRDELKSDYGIRLDDFAREWRVQTDEYVPSPLGMGMDLDEETVSLIQERLLRRAEAKDNRDYDVADAIREELREEHSVFIDDRTREWKVVVENGNDEIKEKVEGKISDTELFDGDDLDADLEAIFQEDLDQASTLLDTAADAPSSGVVGIGDVGMDDIASLDGGSDDDKEKSQLSVDPSELESFTVVQLKEKLRSAGLPVSGKKAELIERLTTTH